MKEHIDQVIEVVSKSIVDECKGSSVNAELVKALAELVNARTAMKVELIKEERIFSSINSATEELR